MQSPFILMGRTSFPGLATNTRCHAQNKGENLLESFQCSILAPSWPVQGPCAAADELLEFDGEPPGPVSNY
jgi:hypothetical protein